MSSTLQYPTYEEYRISCRHQKFSIPDSIVFYMAKNPSTLEIYRKMIKCCKYFFIKNPILVLHCLDFDDEIYRWKTCINESCTTENEEKIILNFDLEELQAKIWVTYDIRIRTPNPNITPSLIQKLYNGNVKSLRIIEHDILFMDLLFFSQNLQQCHLIESNVLNDANGAEMPYEFIISNLPQLKEFTVIRSNDFYDFSKTAKELLKIPHFKNLIYFEFYGFDESFDIDTFYKYLKTNQETRFYLAFSGTISIQLKNKLQSIADKILDAELPRSFRPFYIEFDGQRRRQKLKELHWKKFN